VIQITARLSKPAEYRTQGADSAAVVVLSLEGPVEVTVRYGALPHHHAAAQEAARLATVGSIVQATGSTLGYRADHGDATCVLRNLHMVAVDGQRWL
jgi:hypothetical protein